MSEQNQVRELYGQMLAGWNGRDAAAIAALFQNTPAQFHGRPELAQQLTAELQQLLKGENHDK